MKILLYGFYMAMEVSAESLRQSSYVVGIVGTLAFTLTRLIFAYLSHLPRIFLHHS